MGENLTMVYGVGAWSRWARASKTTTGFDDLDNTSTASCEGSSAAISLPCTSSKSSVNEFFFDLGMLRCKRRCSHAYSKVASWACLKLLPQLCRLPPLRRIQICRRLSKGNETKKRLWHNSWKTRHPRPLVSKNARRGMASRNSLISFDLEHEMSKNARSGMASKRNDLLRPRTWNVSNMKCNMLGVGF